VSDFCLTPTGQFFSYCFLLLLSFFWVIFRASEEKQKLAKTASELKVFILFHHFFIQTTKTGRHDKAEILRKVALNTKKNLKT
jgi:hypothetical protein